MLKDRINTDRKFGIELEAYNEDADRHSKFKGGGLQKISDWKAVHDGSVQGGYCTEVVSPPMTGSKGVEAVEAVTKAMRDAKYKVNETCGFHVHVDCQEMTSPVRHSVVKAQDFYDSFRAKNLERVVFVDKVIGAEFASPKIMKDHIDAWSLSDGQIEYYSDWNQNDFITLHTRSRSNPFLKYKRLKTENVSYIIKVQRSVFEEVEKEVYKKHSLYKNLVEYRRLKNSNITELDELNKLRAIERLLLYVSDKPGRDQEIIDRMISMREVHKNDLVLVEYKEDKNHNYVKNAFAFYLVFSDVLFSMLPKSRRSNKFCRDLGGKYTLAEIEKISSHEDFDKVWYKNSNLSEIKSLKGSKYHESRYFQINFHSLFKFGTIEVRSHSGTLNAKKIINWVHLQQTIVEKCINDPNVMEFVKKANEIKDLDMRTDAMFSYLGLNKNVEKELKYRINKLNSE